MVLFGREREQAQINSMIASAVSGSGTVLAVVGEPGIGKTALLSHAEKVAKGMNLLRARGVQSEAHIPFAGLFELLRPALGALDQIPGPQAEALSGALALSPPRGEGRFAIGAATLSLLAAHAEAQPLLVVVDDAHWLDGSSGSALRFAARRLAGDPVAILLAVRAGEPSLLDGSDLPLLQLEGLDLEASTELLIHHQQSEAVDRRALLGIASRLHRETGGNPLALIELGELEEGSVETPLHEPIPALATVGRAYAERFLSLPDSARKMVLLLASSDAEQTSVLARPAAAMGVRLDDLVPAEEVGLLIVRPNRAVWRHPLARSAVYGAASPAERRAVHRALADALPDSEQDRRAWHLSLAVAGPDATAASALEQAGNRARDRSAHQEASVAFERAARLEMDEHRAARLLWAAADAAWLSGSGERACELLDQAEAQGPGPELRVKIDHLRGHVATRRGQVREGQVILLAGARAAADLGEQQAVVMLAEAVNACFYAGDARTMRRIADDIPAVASRHGDSRSAFFATMSEGMALVFSGESGRGPPLIRRAMTLLESSDELRDDPRLLTWAAMGPLWLREAGDWTRFVDRSLALARERSVAGVLPFLLWHVALHEATTDRWAEAEAAFYEAIDLATEMEQHAERCTALARLAWLEGRTGRFALSLEHASEALARSSELGLGLSEVWALAAMGETELVRGDPKAAMGHFERQQAVLEERGIQDADLSPAPELAETYLRLGFDARATRLAEEYGDAAAGKGLPWVLARAARTRGLVVRGEQFDECFEEAIRWHAASPDVFEAARTHLAYGARLRRSRQRLRARSELRVAIGMFDRVGAAPWSEITRAELSATGERIAKRDVSSMTKLTPQELQIAIHLAQRRTTRETAAALFLSPKTVEYHLRSVYRKLGIASREELAALRLSALEEAWEGSKEGLQRG